MDCSPSDSSVHRILHARILEWVAILFSRGCFLTQESNADLLHSWQILYRLSHQGILALVTPVIVFRVFMPLTNFWFTRGTDSDFSKITQVTRKLEEENVVSYECVTMKNLSRMDGMVWEVPKMWGWCF